MQKLHLLLAYFSVLVCFLTILPFVSCLSNEDVLKDLKSTRLDTHKLSSKKKADVAVHGILLWASMGMLAPLGILIIRMSHKQEGGRRKLLFYLHLIFQVVAVLLATVGAIMSIKSFENSFDNNHQRIGLALYVAIWVQSIIGFFRPPRGSKRRSSWYFVHWILGTVTSIVGIINIYTGLDAYHKKISAKTRTWAILFTAQISLMAFFYLFQEKWDYLQKQGLISPESSELHETAVTPTNQLMIIQTSTSDHNSHKILVPQPCSKNNALKNLFD